MITRVVTDTAYWADGSRAAAQSIPFTLEGSSFTSSELVFPREVIATTNHLGQFSVTLWCNTEGTIPTIWKCVLPTGEVVRFILEPGSGSVSLRSLQTVTDEPPISTIDDARWERLKVAATEYSGYRPSLVDAQFVPVPNTKLQTPPNGTLGVEYINYGAEFTFAEIITSSDGATQGWCYRNGRLYLTPAPATADPITVIWRMHHQPDELTRTFPTIPALDMLIVQMLADAAEAAEEQAAVDAGLKSYTLGGTTVTWAQEGGGSTSGATRAERLRQRALAALHEPLADWG